MLRRLAILLCLTSFATGCFGPRTEDPHPWPTPPVVTSRHHLGSALSGPRAGLLDTPPLLLAAAPVTDSLVVSGAVTEVVGPWPQLGDFEPLDRRVDLVVAPFRSQPLQPHGELLQPFSVGLVDGLWTWLEQVAEPRPVHMRPGALDVGTTYTLRAEHEHAAGGSELAVELAVFRSAADQPVELTVSAEAFDERGMPTAWEQAVLDVDLPVGGGCLLLVVPTQHPRTRLVLSLALGPVNDGPDAGEHGALVASARDDVVDSWRRQVELLASVTASFEGHSDHGAAIAALSRSESRRPALLFLAAELDASAADDLALGGREDLLEAFTAELFRRLANSAQDPPDLFHDLQAAALSVLAAWADGGADDLVVDGLLVRHAGELGRHPARLAELVAASRDRGSLDALLVQENLFFLDDNAPGTRVRAFDWLLVHRASPPGYDPLASRADRRAALQAAREAGAAES